LLPPISLLAPAKNDLPIVRNIVLSDPRREIVANVIRLNTSRMPNSDFGPCVHPNTLDYAARGLTADPPEGGTIYRSRAIFVPAGR
jgi:hypothetical protein